MKPGRFPTFLPIGVALLSAPVLAACSADSEVIAQPSELKFLTYNTGLLASAENVEQRARVIAEDLPSLDADVICLQEVWQYEHVQSFRVFLKDVYPYAHWSIRETTSSSAGCTTAESATLLGCLETACTDLQNDELVSCAVDSCADVFTQVSAECQTCVLSNQTQAPATIGEICESLSESTVTYEQQTGLLLLSKYALQDVDFLPLESSFGDRGVLYARVESAALPAANLFCTHLAATQTSITYPGAYGSWAGERAVQIGALLDYAETKRPSEPNVLMGDLNCGPATATVAGEDPAGFAQLIDAGFEASYLDPEQLGCTWCTDNLLVDDDDRSVMIDHVLFSNLPEHLDTSVTRVFDQPVQLEVNGASVTTHRSDHYGVQVTVTE